jgi:hypothetical protein
MARLIREDRTFEALGYDFGFRDETHGFSGVEYTEAYLGPIGHFGVPFSSGAGCWMLVILATTLLVVAFRFPRLRGPTERKTI